MDFRLNSKDDRAILDFWLSQEEINFASIALWQQIRDQIRISKCNKVISVEQIQQRWIDVIDQYMEIIYGVKLLHAQDYVNRGECRLLDVMQARLIELQELKKLNDTGIPLPNQQELKIKPNQLFADKTFFILRDCTDAIDCAIAQNHEQLIKTFGGVVKMNMEETTAETLIISSLSRKINKNAFKMLSGNLFDFRCLIDAIEKERVQYPSVWMEYILAFDISDDEDDEDEEKKAME